MAEIDKALPNVEQTVNIPSPDDIEVAEQEEEETDEQIYDLFDDVLSVCWSCTWARLSLVFICDRNSHWLVMVIWSLTPTGGQSLAIDGYWWLALVNDGYLSSRGKLANKEALLIKGYLHRYLCKTGYLSYNGYLPNE